MGVKIKIHIDEPTSIIRRIFDDDLGIFVAETWGNIFKKYTPALTKTLSQSYFVRPYEVTYTQIYSHYQWEGISRSGKNLSYNHEINPLAQKKWEQAAFHDYNRDVAEAVSKYLARRV